MESIAWHVGDVVRKLRLKRGLTQKDLAKAAGLHHNTIVRLEDGDEGVQGRTLRKITDALGVSRQTLWALVPPDVGLEQSVALDPERQAVIDRHLNELSTTAPGQPIAQVFRAAHEQPPPEKQSARDRPPLRHQARKRGRRQ